MWLLFSSPGLLLIGRVELSSLQFKNVSLVCGLGRRMQAAGAISTEAWVHEHKPDPRLSTKGTSLILTATPVQPIYLSAGAVDENNQKIK